MERLIEHRLVIEPLIVLGLQPLVPSKVPVNVVRVEILKILM